MLFVTIEGHTRFVGLKADVLYRVELGSAIVDDGERLFRIRAAPFERVVGPGDCDASEELLELVRRHPTVFDWFDDREGAEGSLLEREI